MRRHYLAAVLALALAFPAVISAQGEKKESTGPSPAVEIPEMTHELGRVFERDKYEHTFTVRNRGKADLVIEEVKPG